VICKVTSTLKSGFVRSVSALAGATASAQMLVLLALPFLTRLYTPEEFGLLAIFSALLGMVSVVASLRYQVAIPLPKTDALAANILGVALVAVIGVTVLTVIAVTLFGDGLTVLIDSPELSTYMWLLPIGVAAIGAYNIFQLWATRKRAFKRISITRIEQAVGGVGAQLGLGVAGFGAGGLIVGQLISQGSGFLGLARRAIKEDGHILKQINLRRMTVAASAYRRYPKYSTFEALANSASVQLPLIIIAGFVGSAELGMLMLAMRIMQAPMSLVGMAVSQVYYVQAVDEFRQGRLAELTAKVMGGLAKLGIGPLLFAALVAPSLFGIIFGEAWQRAGVLLAWMTPWFVLQFMTSPVSMALHVTSHQRLALGLQVFGLTFRVTTVVTAGELINGGVSEWYAASGAVFYLFYLIVVSGVVGLRFTDLMYQLWSALPYILVWVVVAISIVLFF